jgi:hypothetical protein
METGVELLDVGEVARRLEISREEAFDLMFTTRELPVQFRDNDHGVPENAVEAYRQTHAPS